MRPNVSHATGLFLEALLVETLAPFDPHEPEAVE